MFGNLFLEEYYTIYDIEEYKVGVGRNKYQTLLIPENMPVDEEPADDTTPAYTLFIQPYFRE